MRTKNPWIFAAMALLLPYALLADAPSGPTGVQTGCAIELPGVPPWLELTCPQALCNDDDNCRSLCPSDPGAFCDLVTWTCIYPMSGGGGGGGCQSGSVCTPARFCNDHTDCTSCDVGCSGYCASDGICRVI